MPAGAPRVHDGGLKKTEPLANGGRPPSECEPVDVHAEHEAHRGRLARACRPEGSKRARRAKKSTTARARRRSRAEELLPGDLSRCARAGQLRREGRAAPSPARPRFAQREVAQHGHAGQRLRARPRGPARRRHPDPPGEAGAGWSSRTCGGPAAAAEAVQHCDPRPAPWAHRARLHRCSEVEVRRDTTSGSRAVMSPAVCREAARAVRERTASVPALRWRWSDRKAGVVKAVAVHVGEVYVLRTTKPSPGIARLQPAAAPSPRSSVAGRELVGGSDPSSARVDGRRMEVGCADRGGHHGQQTSRPTHEQAHAVAAGVAVTTSACCRVETPRPRACLPPQVRAAAPECPRRPRRTARRHRSDVRGHQVQSPPSSRPRRRGKFGSRPRRSRTKSPARPARPRRRRTAARRGPADVASAGRARRRRPATRARCRRACGPREGMSTKLSRRRGATSSAE